MSAKITRRRFLQVGATAAGVVALGGGAAVAATWAPQAELLSTMMGDGEMKALVVYATKSGCTAEIAEKIGETLSDRGFMVRIAPAENAGAASDYDAVIVGSGVRGGNWHEPAKSWVKRNAEALKSRPVAFYTCGLVIQDSSKADEVRSYTDAIIEETGVEPVDVGLFAGWNEPEKFSFLERGIMKIMKAPAGDFRDWNVIAAWAEKIAPQLSNA